MKAKHSEKETTKTDATEVDSSKTESPWLYEWNGLSEYLGGVSTRTLQRWEKENLIKKYKLGRKVFFRKEEIDQALTEIKKG